MTSDAAEMTDSQPVNVPSSVDGSAPQTDSSFDSVVEDEKTNSKLSGDSLDLQAEAATIVTSDAEEMTDSQPTNVPSSVDGSAPQAAAFSDSSIGENSNPSLKKRGVAEGTKRGLYNKDGSLRKKPGPKAKTESSLSSSTPSGDSLDLQAEAATIVASDAAEMTDSQSANVSSAVDDSATQAAASSDSSIGGNSNSSSKKRGVAKGTKRGLYNKDGSLRKKPGHQAQRHLKII